MKLRNMLYTGIFLAGSAIATLLSGCNSTPFKPINQEILDKLNPKNAITTQEKTKQKPLEKIIEKESKEDLKKIPKVNVRFKLDPLLDSYSGAENTISANRAILKSADSLLKKTNCDNLLGRLFKVLTIDTVSSTFFTDYLHEQFGHAYRAREHNLDPRVHIFLRYPCTTERKPYTYVLIDHNDQRNHIKEVLVNMGGLESELIMVHKLAEEMMIKNKQTYYDAFLYFIEKNSRLLVYNQSYPNISDIPKGYVGIPPEKLGENDVSQLMFSLKQNFGVRVSSKNISNAGGAWEFIDSLYLMSIYHTLAHIVKGTKQVPLPKTMVTADYNLTPFGSENYLNFFYRNNKGLLTKIYGRKGMKNNYGIGVKLANIPFKTLLSDRANIGVGLWSQKFPERLKKYNGFGMGLNAEVEKDINKDIFLNLGIRAKTNGYNLGDSLQEDINVYVGGGSKF